MAHSAPSAPRFLGSDQLYDYALNRFPFASEQELAAVVAQIVESVPPAITVTDDGAEVPMSAEMLEDDLPNRLDWIERLKEFAGEAYPIDWETFGAERP